MRLSKLIHVQDRRQLARNFVQQNRVRACRVVRVYRRAFSMPTAMREAISVRQPLVLLGEVAGLSCFHINHADDLVLHDQRNGQLRAHVRDAPSM